MTRRRVWVEATVSGDVDALWRLTQEPASHARWDLRFSAITPSGTDATGRQCFSYALAIPHPRLPLLTVTGAGTSTAERRDDDGAGTSALRFTAGDAPADRLSPLAAGSGFWRYAPQPDGRTRFTTGYDYAPGWGRLGRALDPWLTRPLVGWATAWSFDRLRLWIERGQTPERSRDLALAWTVVCAGTGAGAIACAAGPGRRRPLLAVALAAAGVRHPCAVTGPVGAALPPLPLTGAGPGNTVSVVLGALGADAQRLHPQLRRRFGASTAAGYSCVGRGVMESVWHGPAWTLPFLHLGAWRNILVPDAGSDVPFAVENYAYTDSFGRETLTVVRTFDVAPARRRRFDATLVGDGEGSGRVLDYLGTHQHLAVDLLVSVDDDGSLLITSAGQRFYEGPMGFGFPMLASGTAVLRESYDDERERFTIDVAVSNRRFGPLVGYRGWFTCSYPEMVGDAVPPSVKPLREERRR